MEKHHSSEYNSSSTSQETSYILLNQTAHYHFHKSLLLLPNPSQTSSVYILQSYIIMNHLILCAPLYTGLLSHPPPSHFSTKTHMHFSSHLCEPHTMPTSSSLMSIIFCKYKPWSSSLHFFPQPPVISSNRTVRG